MKNYSSSDIVDILEINIGHTDASNEEITIRGYLGQLLLKLWNDESSFSGKRPFGNSGWKLDLYKGLIESKVIKGSLDDDGYIQSVDADAGEHVIMCCLTHLFDIQTKDIN